MQCFHKEAKLSGNSKVTNWTPESSKGQTVKMVLKSIPGAPQEEAGLTRKFETSHVGGATC